MIIRLALSILFVCLVFCSLVEAKTAKAPLQFVQLEYAKALSERHRVNATVLHVRATGGDGKVTYSIIEQGTPFQVDEKGHIWLMKKLNYDDKKMHVLTLKAAVDKATAYARIRFDVMVKNHAPKFLNETYICAVTENTQLVTILPPIAVLDTDHGSAGKLKGIEIQEDGIPFQFIVDNNGNIKGLATRDLDAEKESNFVFTIRAVDGGGKKSSPSTMKCKVIDANEFAPEFNSDVYTGEVKTGKVYQNILEVHASDKDIGEEFGSVCKYNIETKDVPFNINDSGVLYLKKPLGSDSPTYCTFQVSASDCGSKKSTKLANVTISIKHDCNDKIAIKKPDFDEVIIPQCAGKAIVAPDVGLIPTKSCSNKKTDFSFSATIELKSKVGQGCDRQHYEASGLYKLCGTSDFIDILPKPSKDKQWTSKLKRDGNSFKFDGKTVVKVPKSVLPGEFGDQFTFSTWLQTGLNKHKQVIVANTDKQTHNRLHFALVTHRDELTVVRRLDSRGKLMRSRQCFSDFYYNPMIFDDKWHHLTVVVDGCGVKLFVDGQHQTPNSVESSSLMLHKSRIPVGLYVGAQWMGKQQAFRRYFKGKLSGMAIRLRKPTSEQSIRCLIGCREHVNINIPLPRGFRSELIGFNMMKVHGTGSLRAFESILQNIEYQNELFTPTPGKRKVHISIREDKTKLHEDVTVVVRVEPNKKPVITVQGCKDMVVTQRRLRDMGVPLCNNISITYQGCKASLNSPINNVELLDRVVVKVSPPFKKGECFELPKQQGTGLSILDDLELTSYQDENGIVIRGVANFKTYEQLLREIVYKNEGPKKTPRRNVYIYVSDQNGRFMSDKERLSISMKSHPKPHRKPMKIEMAQRLNLHAVKESLNAEELPGAVTVEKAAAKSGISSGVLIAIIVCSVSVFAFLVVLGLYRLKKTTSVLEVEASPAEKEEMYWDDTGLGGVRITVNPLQKFQELDLNEDKDSDHSDDEDNQEAKRSLEWDEGAI